MKVHHLRNATLIIESGDKVILIDPMLGEKGSSMPFTLFRFKPRKNPLVDLPDNAMKLVEKTTHCFITHLHPDHIDDKAIAFLKDRNIPVICSIHDEAILRKKGLNVTQSLEYWKTNDFAGGQVTGIPAIHGYGFIKKIAGRVMGFHIELPEEQSIYISSDTVYTQHVDRVLKEMKPDIAVLAAGSAQLDFGQPLLMHMQDIIKFVKNAPGLVMANHMEALNHCPTTRSQLKQALTAENLLEKVFIPADGENRTY